MDINTSIKGEEIFKDRKVLDVKNKMMGKLKWSAMLSSISETCKFVAGPLTGVGIGAAMTVGIGPLALALLGTAAVLLAVGITSGFAANRIWQSGQFDNFEMNAASTARHLVQELKANNMCMAQEHEQNCRADGKTWVQAVRRSDQPLQPQT